MAIRPGRISELVFVALLAMLAAPTVADATRALPNACRLLASKEVAAATHHQHVTTRTIVQHGKGVRGEAANFSICDYAIGHMPLAELVLLQPVNAREAGSEFVSEVNMASTNGYTRREVSGPWRNAYQFGTDQIYAFEGEVILEFQFAIDYDHPTRYREGLVLGMTRRAAHVFRSS